MSSSRSQPAKATPWMKKKGSGAPWRRAQSGYQARKKKVRANPRTTAVVMRDGEAGVEEALGRPAGATGDGWGGDAAGVGSHGSNLQRAAGRGGRGAAKATLRLSASAAAAHAAVLRHQRPAQASAPMITGKRNHGSPTRTWVAVAPPR